MITVEEYLDSLTDYKSFLAPPPGYVPDNGYEFATGYLTVRRKRNGKWETLQYMKKNLLTNGGRDFIHAQAYTNAAAGTKGANEVAVSSNATAPAAGDTALAGEITTGGLARAAATAAHSAGTNVTTLTITFTASASHTAVQKGGTFNVPTTGGTLVHENTFTATDLVSGDQLALTWTHTLG